MGRGDSSEPSVQGSCLSSAFATSCVTLGKSQPLSVGSTITSHKCDFPHAKHSPEGFIYKTSSPFHDSAGQGFYLNLPDEKTEAHKWFIFPGSDRQRHDLNPNNSNSNSVLFYKVCCENGNVSESVLTTMAATDQMWLVQLRH